MLYAERDEQARARFQDELADLDPPTLVYLDESGVDEALHRPYARAPRGTKVLGDVAGGRKLSESVSLPPCMSLGC